jgi:antitoxin Phd
MNTYTFTEARRKLGALLDYAEREGEVRIKRRDGKVFVTKLDKRADSPLNVRGLKLNITRKDILESIWEGRRSS